MTTWDDLKFWKTGEWQVMQERLDDWDARKIKYCPKREFVFASLDEVPLTEVKVLILGQDPYPDPKYATGVAFSIPPNVKKFPPTLDMIFKEYVNDLHYDYPTSGDLRPWLRQGVLLSNSIPTCYEGDSLSHNYPEWTTFTRELVETVSRFEIVCCFLGSIAREHAKYCDNASKVIEASHPSPRGNRFGKQPFIGSRIFSRINAELKTLGKTPINWRL